MDSIHKQWLKRIRTDMITGRLSSPIEFWIENVNVRKRIRIMAGEYGYRAEPCARPSAAHPGELDTGVRVTSCEF